MHRRTLLFVASVCALCALVLVTPVAAKQSSGIVSSVAKAPIVPDGDVAGAFTDLVIDLDTSLDPSVDGRTLLDGKEIRITFPDDFVVDALSLTGNPSIAGGPCNPAPANGCNTGVLLQGWPQAPIPPVPGVMYDVSRDGQSIVFTAQRDLTPRNPGPPPVGPGIKQIHLILNGFTNPGPGRYPILVEAETGPGGALETGTGYVHIRPNDRPSINVTSVFTTPSPAMNTIFQATVPGGTVTWDFLLWDTNGDPFNGVSVQQVNTKHAQLLNGSTVGQITMEAPAGENGQTISGGPSFGINSPISGLPTSRLTVAFTAGQTEGTYTTTLRMSNGNDVTMYVDVIDD